MTSLRNKTSRALAWDLVGNYGGQITYFIISIFLARLLSPVEFGLVGMSMVFIAILKIFADMGFASALVQNKENTSLTYSSIFYLNVFAGLVFTIVVFFSAPLIGNFYGNDEVTLLVRLLSINFILNSFNIVQSTILRKRLDFKKISLIVLTSQVCSGIVAIIVAFYGYGVYALVIQQLLTSFINVVFIWKVAEWHPKLEFSWVEVKKLTGFSMYVFAAQSVNQLIKQSDTLVVGKLFSPATLGFFSRAESINSLISKNSVGSLNKVFFPVLSSIQDNNAKFQEIFIRVINIVATISTMLTGILFLCGEELIIGLFGEKWQPSVLIFQILIIKGFSYPISAMIVNAFFAKGKSKENFKYGNIRKVLQMLPWVIAYLYGFEPFLYGLVLINIFGWILNSYFVTRSLKVPFLEQMSAVVPQLIVSLILTFAIYMIFPDDFSYLWAIAKVSCFMILYLGYLYFSKSLLIEEFLVYKNKIWKR